MITTQDIDELKNVLPDYCDNYIGAIVTRSGLTYPTVTKFFNNIEEDQVRRDNAQKIYANAIELIREEKEREDKLRQAFKEAIT